VNEDKKGTIMEEQGRKSEKSEENEEKWWNLERK